MPSKIDKSPRLTIGLVAKELGISTGALRRWEARGIIRPPRRDWTGRRVYRADDLPMLRTLAGVGD
jgi:DNA-binding transcriptional MerR regulator